jgi:hypothetical protein
LSNQVPRGGRVLPHLGEACTFRSALPDLTGGNRALSPAAQRGPERGPVRRAAEALRRDAPPCPKRFFAPLAGRQDLLVKH